MSQTQWGQSHACDWAYVEMGLGHVIDPFAFEDYIIAVTAVLKL